MNFEALKIQEQVRNPEEELRELRKKQFSCMPLPEDKEVEFSELKRKEEEGRINNIEANRLKIFREKYWILSEDQARLVELAEIEGKGLSAEENKRFLDLSKKQTDGTITEKETEEIRVYYRKMEKEKR